MIKYNYPAIIEGIIEGWSDILSDWELDFLDSVGSQDYPLTDPQKETILRISGRVKGG